MTKTKNGQETLISRSQYAALKKMDRSEVECFLREFHQKGYVKGISERGAVRKEADFIYAKLAVLSHLRTTKGIGPTVIEKVEKAFGDVKCIVLKDWERGV